MTDHSGAWIGALLTLGGGLLSGSAAWPIKILKRYQFEHWWLVAMGTSLVAIPWSITLAFCPNALEAYRSVPLRTLLVANFWAIGWGVANVLCGLCYLRLGMALTSAIVTGVGAAIGVVLPMVVKGSGIFQHASSPVSATGALLLGGVAVLLAGVVVAGLAGAGRHRAATGAARGRGGFLPGLAMAFASGVFAAGLGLSFVYGQGPIMEAMKREGAGELAATFSVYAVGLVGGAAVSLLYPVWLLRRNRSWGVLAGNWGELALAVTIGVNASLAVVLMGVGMRKMGPMGAAVGLGMQSAAWMLGGQIVGFASGEWRGIRGTPRRRMYVAIGLLTAAAGIMVWAGAGRT